MNGTTIKISKEMRELIESFKTNSRQTNADIVLKTLTLYGAYLNEVKRLEDGAWF